MCLDLFSEEIPVFCILAGRFEDLGSIAFIYWFFFLRKLDLLRLLTESGIKFQLDTLILMRDDFLHTLQFESIW